MIRTRIKTFLHWVPVLVAIFVALEVVVANQSAGSGKEVSKLDGMIEQLTHKNEILEQQLASASSLMTISVKAKELGFVEPSKSQLLTVGQNELPVALGIPR